ncbi:MAG TPA: S4 domain-containing protein [Bacteroidales bacterium]|nr:S4 domain-containing protein [Bacteroidales bacterium]
MSLSEGLRIDKWLWAVRVFRTRSLATQACKAGKVKVEGQEVKPSREVRKDLIIQVNDGPLKRLIKVVELSNNRVGPKLVNSFMHDLTPPEEYEKLRELNKSALKRPRGAGRPTKKERRDIGTWLGWD